MPPREHPLDFVEHPRPDSSRFAFALDDGLDISFEVSPAELPTAVRPPGIGAVSVGHEDAEPVTEQLLGGLGVAPRVDHEDDDMRGDDRPQPGSGSASALAPPGLIGMLDGLLFSIAPRVLHGLGNGRTRRLLTPDDRADRHLKSEEIARQFGHLALGEPINTHQHGDDRIHRRSERASGDAFWQLAHRPVVAQPAVERVLLVLRDDRLDGRQFEHLMSMRFGVSTVKEPGTFIALLRDTGNDFVDLFRRHQDTLVPLVPWLSPWLASLRRLLRSRLHPGTIAGGRLR